MTVLILMMMSAALAAVFSRRNERFVKKIMVPVRIRNQR